MKNNITASSVSVKTTGTVVRTFVACVVLSGCAGPSVRYMDVNDASNEKELRGDLQFSLYGSRVTLTKPTGDPKDSGVTAIGLTKTTPVITSLSDLDDAQALVTPAPSAYQYAIQPTDNALHQTKLNGTYIDNTRLFKSVGVDFQDQTVQIIQAVGAVAVAALALATVGERPQGLTLPVVLDASDPKKWNNWISIAGANANGWRYRIVKPAADELKGSTEREAFFRDYEGSDTNLLPVSACARTRVDITNDASGSMYKSFFVTIADPDYLYTYKLPAKGAITMHSICGADVSVEGTNNGTLTALQALEAAFKQVEAIKAAQDAPKK